MWQVIKKPCVPVWCIQVLIGAYYGAAAQTEDVNANRSSYYINVNRTRAEVYDVYDDLLSLAYDDRYGQAADIPLTLYNWKHEKVGQYRLQKSYGLNHFNIALNGAALALDETYCGQLIDEGGRRYELFFKRRAPPEADAPQVSILVNPVSFECGNPTQSLVEFYGQIQAGRAPYEVNWYVMNPARTAFLYQPRDASLAHAGATPVVQVEHLPDYYILLNVRDACGREAQQMVYLTCSRKKGKVHTVMVEPLKKLPTVPSIKQ